MISRLNIKNIKSHRDTTLRLAPLTILTGINGMGKSTVMQTLMLLRQSDFGNDFRKGLDLKGRLVETGASGTLACQSANSDFLEIDMTDDGHDWHWRFKYPSDFYDTSLPLVEYVKPEGAPVPQLFTQNFQYLSAFRFGPKTLYKRHTSLVETDRQISDENGQCEYAIHFLNHNRKTQIPIKELALANDGDELSSADFELWTQVLRWMQKISPNIRMEIEPSGGDFKLNYIYARENNTATGRMEAINTGFGISYVLPILVAILSSAPGAMILIENPEAHIHPKAQSTLMKLISLGVAHGLQIIIETHSDHIINGALVSMSKNVIGTDHIAIYFFNRDEHEHVATVHELDVREGGIIMKPPRDFFDQLNIDLRIISGLDDEQQ